MIAYLKEHIYSHFRQGKKEFFQYGSKGDKVDIISDRGNVLIVQGPKGNRFPVESEKVLSDK